jgi:excisionase family DNA binding protein
MLKVGQQIYGGRKLNTELAVRLMPVEAVANALGVSVYTVRRLVASGAIESVRIGARVMVSSAVVERVQSQGVAAPAVECR